MYERPRGGMKISLVDVSSTMSPGAYCAVDAAANDVPLVSATLASRGISAPAPATPIALSHSRLEMSSIMAPIVSRVPLTARRSGRTVRCAALDPRQPPRRD